jgi:type II secretory pathway predicted ATPase ExeA/outer membrane protein OmpA-like peptidoglycan-associated protein
MLKEMIVWRSICKQTYVAMAQSVDDLILRHFSLRENPFGVTPDPRFLFMSLTHREAFASLVNGIECGFGFQVLVAQPGMGKTTLLFDFLERFRSSRTAFLFQQQHDSREFLQSLLIELKTDPAEISHAKLYSQLNQLLSEAAITRERVIVVVDEAQNLDDSVLETLRQLSNFETSRSKLLQIVLAGQPELARKLAKPEQQQLRQRISTIARLSPLGLDETQTYLNHRLRIAGYRGPEFFSKPVLQLIWSKSGGIPRNINTLCFNSMLLAFAERTKRLDEDAISEAARDLDLDFVLADVAGSHSHPPLDRHQRRSLTAEFSVNQANPTQQFAAPQSTKNNRQPPCEAQLIAGQVPRSEPAVGRKPASDAPKTGGQTLAAQLSHTNENLHEPITKFTRGTSSIRLQETNKPSLKLQQTDAHPVIVPASSKANSEHSNKLKRSSGISTGRKLAWGALVVAAAGAGVLFGHGLGNRDQQSAEHHLESFLKPQQAREQQLVSATPLTPSRKDKGTQKKQDIDFGPEVVVRTFPQSTPGVAGIAQENSGTIFFDGDSAEVSASYNNLLQRIAESLIASPQSNAILTGHTDTSGEEIYNQDFSMRRAAAVSDILVKRYRIAPSRLSTVGSGSTAPLGSNDTNSGRAYNRRVEIRIVRSENTLVGRSKSDLK